MRQRTKQMTSGKVCLIRNSRSGRKETGKGRPSRERSRKGRREDAVKSAGEEGRAFNRGSHLDEVTSSGSAKKGCKKWKYGLKISTGNAKKATTEYLE